MVNLEAADPAGRRLQCVVTRPAAQAGDWVQTLRAAGLDAQALPLIDIAPAPDQAAVRAAWQGLRAHALVMFVSANAVQHFFAARPDAAAGWPAGVLAAAAGPGTAAALVQAGVPAAQCVSPPADAPAYDTETLWDSLRQQAWAGHSVLIVRGDGGRDWLADTLRAHGAQVQFVCAYQRQPPQPDAAGRALLARALLAPASQLWLFSSSEAVAHLCALLPGARWTETAALATHARIAQAAREAGFGRVQAVGPQRAAVVAAAQAEAQRWAQPGRPV